MRPRYVLCATDFLPAADLAFETACGIAREHGARLLLLHVHEVPLGLMEDAPERVAADRRALAALAARARERCATQVEACVIPGHPWHRIVDLARSEGCDLIVLGAHGRSTEPQLDESLGSVAEAVTRHATCSVMVVRIASREDRQQATR